jgi:hypothetical protein
MTSTSAVRFLEPAIRSINSATGHGTLLRFDHIREFTTDPVRGPIRICTEVKKHVAESLSNMQRSRIREKLLNNLGGCYRVVTFCPDFYSGHTGHMKTLVYLLEGLVWGLD